MQKSLTSWICSGLLVVALPFAAVAEPINAVPKTHNGQAGVWLPRDDAGRVLQEVAKVPEYKETIKSQDELIDLLKVQTKTATSANQQLQDALQQSTEFGQHFHDAYLEEVDRNGSIWNSSTFWLITGVVIGGAVAGGTAAVMN